MKPFLIFSLILLFSPLFALSSGQQKNIVVGSFSTSGEAEPHHQQLEKWAKRSEKIRAIRLAHPFYVVTRKSGSYYIVALEPIGDEAALNELYALVKPEYKDAFIGKAAPVSLLNDNSRNGNPVQVPVEKKRLDLKDPAKENIEETADKDMQKSAAGKGGEIEDTWFLSLFPVKYLWIAFVVILSLLVYFLLRYRKEASYFRSIEEENSNLNSSNLTLSAENREYRQTIDEHRELLEGMTNKLKDPTKSLLGKTQKMLMTQLNDKQSIELRNIQDSGQVVFEIVDDLLDFMKIRSNKLQIEEKLFDINQLLDMIVHSVLERIEKKDVEVIFDIDGKVPPRILGDPIRIGQILTNLLENGIKFTHSGEVRLNVKLLGKVEENLQLMFEVIDTGIGIPESKLDDIFTPFYQINNNSSAGLGLSISKALVEMMGGEILVSTELNRGSTFTFVLVLKQYDSDEQRHYHLPEKAYKRRRILIIDYQDSAAAVMKKMLEYFHNDVDIIPESELEIMAPNLGSYDMLFVSEKLLGFDLVKQIGHLKADKEIKLVVVGSMLHKHVRNNVVESLADRRIMKPVNQQTIFDLLVAFYGDEEAIVTPEIPKDGGVSNVSMPRIVIARTQKQNVTKDDFRAFGGATILMAEDNLINQKVISSLLQESGIHIDMAENGKIALELVKDKMYDLVLMDINMPVMNGYEATERLKSSKHTAHIPVVALSGNTMPDEIAQMKECGMDDRLEKPIKVQAIYSVFSKYLEYHPLTEGSVDSSLPDRLYLFEEGLDRVGGDIELYREIVEEFIKLYGDSEKLMEKFYAQKDSAALKALSLDIKGVSANIGACVLAKSAEKIHESSLSSTSMPKFLESYKMNLAKTMEVLTERLKSL